MRMSFFAFNSAEISRLIYVAKFRDFYHWNDIRIPFTRNVSMENGENKS